MHFKGSRTSCAGIPVDDSVTLIVKMGEPQDYDWYLCVGFAPAPRDDWPVLSPDNDGYTCEAYRFTLFADELGTTLSITVPSPIRIGVALAW